MISHVRIYLALLCMPPATLSPVASVAAHAATPATSIPITALDPEIGEPHVVKGKKSLSKNERRATGAQKHSVAKPSPWVEEKLKAMTLREKIGQMLMIDLPSHSIDASVQTLLATGEFGNIILFSRNLLDYEQTRLLTTQLQTFAIVRTGIPMLITVDQEGGQVDRLSRVTQNKSMRYSARTLGSVYSYAPKRADRALRRATAEIASWLKELGFNMNLAPVLDIAPHHNSYIFNRSYGSDPSVVAHLGLAYAKTMASVGIACTGKHFPNLSNTIVDSHKDLPILKRTLDELRSYEFRPFLHAADDLGAIMVGHVLVPAIDPLHPSSMSSPTGTLLRKELGFDGVLITDDLKMKAISNRYSLRESIIRAVFADMDILMLAWDEPRKLESQRILEDLVVKGQITHERIDRSVRRILSLKDRFAR